MCIIYIYFLFVSEELLSSLRIRTRLQHLLFLCLKSLILPRYETWECQVSCQQAVKWDPDLDFSLTISGWDLPVEETKCQLCKPRSGVRSLVVWVAEIRRKGGKDDELLNYDCPATARSASVLPDGGAQSWWEWDSPRRRRPKIGEDEIQWSERF